MTIRMLYVHVLPVDALAANAVQVLKMCQAFSDAGVQVTLAVPEGKQPRSEDDYKKAVEAKLGKFPDFSIITFRQYTFFGRFKLLGGYFPVKKLLSQFRPDVVFLRNIVLVRAAMKTGVPFIYESHNSLMHNTSGFLDNYWTQYILKVAPDALMKKFVSISGALGDYWLKRGMPADKSLAVHDGFDASCFQRQIDKVDARKMIGLPEDMKIVLYMGSLYADREIDNIIDMADKLDDVYFLIVGGTDAEKDAYQKIASDRQVENINFWGSVNHKDVPLYLYAADILLMIWSRKVKTIEYCSPLKLFEYMAAGRIIVGHGFTTIREVLTHGENAYLVDPDLDGDLYEKLKLAVDTMPEDFGDRARQLAFERYSWEKRARAIIDSSFT